MLKFLEKKIEHITSKLLEEKKMARELSDSLEPSKVHHKEYCFCTIYLYTEQLTLQRKFALWLTLWALNSSKISAMHG